MGYSKSFCKVLIMLLLQNTSYGVGINESTRKWELVEKWPAFEGFGQISAVSIDSEGNVYVFHRGNRVWDQNSFDSNHIFAYKNSPIPNETLIILNETDGTVKKKTGNQRFYMPHGLTVDHQNNIWITDVALHQVFKFAPLNLSSESHEPLKAILTLGSRFEPGKDDNHFCKPTDVAVDKYTNEFFVSDGYCNARIIKYDQFGKKLVAWGRSLDTSLHNSLDPYILIIPHALSIAVDEQIIFVADREHNRTVAYNITTGNYYKTFQDSKQIYSIAYLLRDKSLYTLSTASASSPGAVTVYNIKNENVLHKFLNPYNFSSPHDIALSEDGKFCYVVELNPHKIWKFHLDTLSDRESVVSTETLDSDMNQDSNQINIKREDKMHYDFPGGMMVAIGLVSFVIVIIFFIFILHVYKRKGGYSQYEMRKLILEDEEEVGIGLS